MLPGAPLTVPAASLLLLACSGGARGANETDALDDALVVPEHLVVQALAGGNGVLRVTALTLQRGTSGIELYAALKNDGDIAACDAALSIELTRISRDTGTAYAGTLVNELDVVVLNPSVTVFPMNRAGRPVGAVTGSGASAISPRSRWAFETTPIDVPAVDYAAYPAGGFAD